MQYIEQLALVLVEALHLDVENSVGVQGHTGFPADIGGKTALVLLLDLLQALEN